MAMLRALETVTLKLDGAQAELVLASLHMLGLMTDDADLDTETGAEAWAAYCDLVEQVYGSGAGRQDVVEALSKKIKVDVFKVIHRDYERTSKGFEEK